MWGKIFSTFLENRALVDPKGVPWDQNFWSKNFLIQSVYDVYLIDFLIYYLKIIVYLVI